MELPSYMGLCFDDWLFDNKFEIIISTRIILRIAEPLIKGLEQVSRSLCLVDHASFVNTLLLFQLDTIFCFPYIFTIFSTCFGPAGPSSGESNYTRSVWSLSLVRC